MMAVLGRSRALYALGKYGDALEGYQEVLSARPDLIDPDPRIGVGCCFWMLGFKDDAKIAWERALELVSNCNRLKMILRYMLISVRIEP
jgi:RNA polymerase-associated protein CTR9